jgi:hypothetical protein
MVRPLDGAAVEKATVTHPRRLADHIAAGSGSGAGGRVAEDDLERGGAAAPHHGRVDPITR